MSLLCQQKKSTDSEAVQLLLLAGYNLRDDTWISCSRNRLPEKVYELLKSRQEIVPTLAALCRTRVRERLSECHRGRGILRRTAELPLPVALHEYLALVEELGIG